MNNPSFKFTEVLNFWQSKQQTQSPKTLKTIDIESTYSKDKESTLSQKTIQTVDIEDRESTQSPKTIQTINIESTYSEDKDATLSQRTLKTIDIESTYSEDRESTQSPKTIQTIDIESTFSEYKDARLSQRTLKTIDIESTYSSDKESILSQKTLKTFDIESTYSEDRKCIQSQKTIQTVDIESTYSEEIEPSFNKILMNMENTIARFKRSSYYELVDNVLVKKYCVGFVLKKDYSNVEDNKIDNVKYNGFIDNEFSSNSYTDEEQDDYSYEYEYDEEDSISSTVLNKNDVIPPDLDIKDTDKGSQKSDNKDVMDKSSRSLVLYKHPVVIKEVKGLQSNIIDTKQDVKNNNGRIKRWFYKTLSIFVCCLNTDNH